MEKQLLKRFGYMCMVFSAILCLSVTYGRVTGQWWFITDMPWEWQTAVYGWLAITLGYGAIVYTYLNRQ